MGRAGTRIGRGGNGVEILVSSTLWRVRDWQGPGSYSVYAILESRCVDGVVSLSSRCVASTGMNQNLKEP